MSLSIRSAEPEVRIVNRKLWVEMIEYVELHKAEWTPGYLVAGMFWQYWGMARKTTFESTSFNRKVSVVYQKQLIDG